MGGIRRVVLGLSSLAVVGHAADVYGSCASSPPTDCWKDWTGLNPSLVDVGPGIICEALAGNGINEYNDELYCMKAGPDGAAPVGVFPPPNMGSIIQNVPGKRVKSLTIGNATAAKGPVFLHVLLEDNNLYRAQADSRFRNGLDNFTNLVLVNQPIDAGTGLPLTFRNISGVHPPVPQSYYPIAIGTNGVVYWPSGDKWRPIPSMAGTSYFMGYGGPFGAILLKGTGSSETIATRLRSNPDAEVLMPSFPSGLNFAYAPTFNLLGPTQPMALGTEDAWIITNHTNPDTFIRRSTLTNGVWSAWTGYPTAPLPSSPDPTLPWTIVDARELRGIRGSLIGVGLSWRLLEYFPP